MHPVDHDVARGSITTNLKRFSRVATPRADLKAASVALCIVIDESDLSLLITQRAAGLRAHAGQWALPGGRRDAGESLEEAARRELAEETGLRTEESDVLGVLDDYVTRSGYVISPVVIWGGPVPTAFTAAESEVAEIHVISTTDLDVEPRFVTIPESDRAVIQLPLLGDFVHAPTAAIIHQFCQVCLHGTPARVAHFEQPVFAWK